jgi:hypothetical protein
MTDSNNDTSSQIQQLLEKNKIEDLKRFLSRRKYLNCSNIALLYLFHIIQSAGILTTTIAAGYDNRNMVWIGAGLNALAAIIHIFERTNESLINQYGKDIQNIKDDKYLDESAIDVESEEKETK